MKPVVTTQSIRKTDRSAAIADDLSLRSHWEDERALR